MNSTKSHPSFSQVVEALKEAGNEKAAFNEVEKMFPLVFGFTYEEFLKQKYITEDYTLNQLAQELNISRGTVPYHLGKYNLSKERKIKRGEFTTISAIEKDTGRKFIDIYNEMLDQGYSQTQVAIKLNLRGSNIISGYLNRMRRLETKSDHPTVFDKLKDNGIGFRLTNLIKHFPSLFGMEYEEYLRENYIDNKMSYPELSALIGTNSDTLTRHLRHFDISKTRAEARADAIDKGYINYDKILSKARMSMKKSKFNSNTQEYIHGIIQEKITQHLLNNKMDHIEVVTSLNEWSILKDREVDIVIVLIDTNKNTYKKFSIEFQGSFFHKDRQEADINKKVSLEDTGWKHFEVDYSENYSDMNKSVNEVVETVFSYIK